MYRRASGNYLVMMRVGWVVVVVGSFGWEGSGGSPERVRTLGRLAAQRAAILR